jgi:hypothetical protein
MSNSGGIVGGGGKINNLKLILFFILMRLYFTITSFTTLYKTAIISPLLQA